MQKIKVSVIVPTFNRADLLIQTLDSLLYQDFPINCFEVIVVDNNSTDNTSDLVKVFLKRNASKINLKYLVERRQGDIYARHSGAFHAEGEILLFTDDDATFDANWISEIVSTFEKFPQVGAVGTRIVIKWDKTPKSWVYNYESLLGKISFGNGHTVNETGMYINNGSLAIKKNIYKLVKGNNPGQIGNYLFGDAEVGLCRKLHQQKISIGFTDYTTMWHHQFVARNGIFKDILRRVINNGRAEAYTDIYVDLKNNCGQILAQLVFSVFNIFKAVITLRKIKIINSIFRFYQIRYRLLYFRKFKKDKLKINNVQKFDWFFDDNYIADRLLINNKI